MSFNLLVSEGLSEAQKQRVFQRLKNRLTKDGVLIMQCSESRSQHKNKALIITRFLKLIRNALLQEKERVPTKIPRAAIQKRLKSKRKLSDKKANRRKPDID